MSNRRTVACDLAVEPINPSECLSLSLGKINRNFANLESVVCTLENRVTNNAQVRTFFYYGPNAQSNAAAGMQDNIVSRPANATIEAYLNATTQLNLPPISFRGDVAYVIYQKTGFYSTRGLGIRFEDIPPSTLNQGDTSNYTMPVFIIWKLTFNGTRFVTDMGFPKFSAALTTNTGDPNSNWNQPQNWRTF